MRAKPLTVLFVSLLTLAAAAPSASAASTDALLELVPRKAYTVASMDHARLKSHAHYSPLMSFLRGEGWGSVLMKSADAKMVPGKDVLRSMSFRLHRLEGAIVSGKLKPRTIKKAAAKRLGAEFKEAKHAGRTYFTVTKRLWVADVGGGRMAVGPEKLLEAVLDVAAGSAKPVTGRSHFKRLRKEAERGDPPLWVVAYVPKRIRDGFVKKGAGNVAHVERATLAVIGKADMTLRIVGHTKDEAGAKETSDGINGKIERKIHSNGLLNAIGVSAVFKQLTVDSKGKTVRAKMKLSEAQVGVLARYGSKILKILE